MFVAMNNFQIAAGKEGEFERIWKERQSYLESVPGFVQFLLLRGDSGEFISHSTWQDRASFEAWTRSDAFVQGHRQAGSLMGVVDGPPHVKMYDAVIVETPESRTVAGG
jgi:heme-degrading monooxygenase HmoA